MAARVKSFWATRGESIQKKFGDTTIGRDVKLGMTVESDSGDRSEDMHLSIIKALNVAYEKEREDWMNDDVMKKEIDRLETLVPSFDEDGNPIIHTYEQIEKAKKEKKLQSIRRPSDGSNGQDSDTGNGEF